MSSIIGYKVSAERKNNDIVVVEYDQSDILTLCKNSQPSQTVSFIADFLLLVLFFFLFESRVSHRFNCRMLELCLF